MRLRETSRYTYEWPGSLDPVLAALRDLGVPVVGSAVTTPTVYVRVRLRDDAAAVDLAHVLFPGETFSCHTGVGPGRRLVCEGFTSAL